MTTIVDSDRETRLVEAVLYVLRSHGCRDVSEEVVRELVDVVLYVNGQQGRCGCEPF